MYQILVTDHYILNFYAYHYLSGFLINQKCCWIQEPFQDLFLLFQETFTTSWEGAVLDFHKVINLLKNVKNK